MKNLVRLIAVVAVATPLTTAVAMEAEEAPASVVILADGSDQEDDPDHHEWEL